jgi:16S rRNA U516 pseudouridylate synthase RsuA-like enzyme
VSFSQSGPHGKSVSKKTKKKKEYVMVHKPNCEVKNNNADKWEALGSNFKEKLVSIGQGRNFTSLE